MSARAELTEPSEPAEHTASRAEQNRSESFDEALTLMYTSSAERLRRVWERLRALPAWLSVLLIYGISRVLGFVVFAVVGQQHLRGPLGEHLGYLSFISTWDAGWYEQIALNGYPSELPVNAMGAVQQNQWAFYPIFPLLSQVISRLTGIAYYPVAAAVAMLAGFAAAWIIYLLFDASVKAVRLARSGSDSADAEPASTLALWGVALVSFLPVAPVLQVPYAESLNLVFLAGALLCLVKGRYGWLVPVAALACLSRPVGVPLGAVAGLWWFGCWARSSRVMGIGTAFVRHAGQLVSDLLVCACALVWPAIAWWATGRVDAYTATETAWRGTHLAPIEPWLTQGYIYFGYAAPILLVLLILGFVALCLSPVARGVLAAPLNLWCACYFAYLILFLNPQSSTFRLLLPLFPLVVVVAALSRSRAYRWALLVAGACAQWGWVGWLWHWKQLPGGGDYPP